MTGASSNPHCVLRFDLFEIDARAGEIRKGGVRIPLQDQPFRILTTLVARPGELLTREELRQELWPADTFVDFEHGLNAAIKRLRHALGDSAEAPRFIETHPRHGYRFIAPVSIVEDGQGPPAVGVASVPDVKGRRTLVARGVGRWVALLLVILAAAGLAVTWRAAGTNTASARSSKPPTIKSVAVLPLRNLTRDAQQDWLAESLTEELTSAISQVSGVRAISGISARHFRGTNKTAPEIARELGGIDALLEGSVMRDGDRVRIAVYLDETLGNRRIWAGTYERSLGDSLQLLGEIAHRVAIEVRATLTVAEEARLATARAVKSDAYEAYLHGVYFRDRQMDGGCVAAEPHLLQAVAIDPSFAAPHAALAYCYGANRFNGQLPAVEALAKGHAEVDRALELEPQLAEAHGALALMRHRTEYDWPAAERSFKRALAAKSRVCRGPRSLR